MDWIRSFIASSLGSEELKSWDPSETEEFYRLFLLVEFVLKLFFNI